MTRRLIIVPVLVVILASWVLIAPLLAKRLIVERPLERADAIVVLSGSAVYKERTKKAAELYKRGVASRIFITNDGERAGWLNTEKRNPPFVELEQRELIANGVLPDSITVLPGEVTGTEWEGTALANEIDERPLASVVIVTSPYHTRRSFTTFERSLAGKGVEVGIEHTPLSERTPKPETWWLSVTGWQTIGGEYVKLVAYWMFY